MKKYVIIYGSATGVTADVATRIGEALGVDKQDVVDVAKISPDIVRDYEFLILGTSTWGDGEIEEDWYDMLAALEVMSLKDKKVALFGCGDENMTDTFCNGVGELYNRLKATGAQFVGAYNADCYDFNSSSAVVDGKPVGLLLDQVNKSAFSDERIKEWAEIVKKA